MRSCFNTKCPEIRHPGFTSWFSRQESKASPHVRARAIDRKGIICVGSATGHAGVVSQLSIEYQNAGHPIQD